MMTFTGANFEFDFPAAGRVKVLQAQLSLIASASVVSSCLNASSSFATFVGMSLQESPFQQDDCILTTG
jgi:hypothetical protein